MLERKTFRITLHRTRKLLCVFILSNYRLVCDVRTFEQIRYL
ncbi:hypothetical protein TSAR_001529 [Trichomalopsis sarcophagae]|uniref:Uncharacterized protein n=1 Tax=Trichomalopsis sarcophagae TaxID=543379 RepID=A0A232FBE2_9HYME|nr:hypothetical protein TSAR_001529 [Trichomalopsis sarcophagae]